MHCRRAGNGSHSDQKRDASDSGALGGDGADLSVVDEAAIVPLGGRKISPPRRRLPSGKGAPVAGDLPSMWLRHATTYAKQWVDGFPPFPLFAGRLLRGATFRYVGPSMSDGHTPSPAASMAVVVGPSNRGGAAPGGSSGRPSSSSSPVPPEPFTWLSVSYLKQCFGRLRKQRMPAAVADASKEAATSTQCNATAATNAGKRRGGGMLRILVSGDSQSRSVYWALDNYLWTVLNHNHLRGSSQTAFQEKKPPPKGSNRDGVAPPLSYELRDAKGEKIKEASSSSTEEGFDVKLYYKWDSYLDQIAQNSAEADVVIAGYGSHPASWGQWTFERFGKETRERVAPVLCHNSALEGKAVVWYGCPAWPKPKLVENFRATNQRLGLFNGIAARIIHEECVKQGDLRSTTTTIQKRQNIQMKANDVAASAGVPRTPGTPRRCDINHSSSSSMLLDNGGGAAMDDTDGAAWSLPPPALGLRMMEGGDDEDEPSSVPNSSSSSSFVSFVDFFAMTAPMLKLSKDGSHYDGSIVAPMLAHEILLAICSR